MRIGATVVRVKNEFNLSTEGDIRVINNMKIYNKGLCLNLEGDKPETWHSGNDFRLIEDVDMPALAIKLQAISQKVAEATAKWQKSRIEREMRTKAKFGYIDESDDSLDDETQDLNPLNDLLP
jgi:hypothetical protein